MLLKRLTEYAGRLDLPPRLYSHVPVRYIIELDSDGRPLTPELIDTADASSAAAKRGVRRPTPAIQRTVAIRPLLLSDKADYVLGLADDETKRTRAAQSHRAFVELVGRCANTTDEPAVKAVLTFLRDRPSEKLRVDGIDLGATIAFRVDGVFPTDLPAVQQFWADENESDDAPSMQCITCGQVRPVLPRLELKVKGVPGGQTSGTSIISFNADAFESYGLSASLNAPTCASCGERLTQGINDLLAHEETCLRLQNAAYIFWTRELADTSFLRLLRDPQPEDVREYLRAPITGSEGAAGLEIEPFYGCALSGSGGRAVVRDWIETTLEDAKRHFREWFLMQRLGTGADMAGPFGLRQLAYATVRTGDRKNPPDKSVSAALLRTALRGDPLPWGLLYQAVRRNRAEQSVRSVRAALIKMVLLSQQQNKEDDMIELNPEHTSAAYHCGRLLAVLEQAQRAAIPGINATIVDRFYGAASSAPCSVLPTLLRGARAHLDKLERDRRGAYIALERRLDEIVGRIPELPATLSLVDQGRFALGYYHQRSADRAAAREAAERRKAGAAAPEAELAGLIEPDSTNTEEANQS